MALTDRDNFLYREGPAPNTRIAVSQKLKLYSIPYGSAVASQIGVLNEFTTNGESRDVTPVWGVGFGDRILEVIPGKTNQTEITMARRLQYLSCLHQVLGYRGGAEGVTRSIRHHRWPFDIRRELVFSIAALKDGGGVVEGSLGVDDRLGTDWDSAVQQASKAIVTYYEGCWVNSYQESGMTADGAILDESVGAVVTDVVSHLGYLPVTSAFVMNTGNNPYNGEPGSAIFKGRTAVVGA